MPNWLTPRIPQVALEQRHRFTHIKTTHICTQYYNVGLTFSLSTSLSVHEPRPDIIFFKEFNSITRWLLILRRSSTWASRRLEQKSQSRDPVDVRTHPKASSHLRVEEAVSFIDESDPVQGALQWLEDNQDKSLEDIEAAEAEKGDDEDESEEATQAKIAEIEAGSAKSLVCNDCQKKFRNHDAAEFHATKR